MWLLNIHESTRIFEPPFSCIHSLSQNTVKSYMYVYTSVLSQAENTLGMVKCVYTRRAEPGRKWAWVGHSSLSKSARAGRGTPFAS